MVALVALEALQLYSIAAFSALDVESDKVSQEKRKTLRPVDSVGGERRGGRGGGCQLCISLGCRETDLWWSASCGSCLYFRCGKSEIEDFSIPTGSGVQRRAAEGSREGGKSRSATPRVS